MMSDLPNFSITNRRAVVGSLRRQWASSDNAPFLPVLLGEKIDCRVVWAEASGHGRDATSQVLVSAETPVFEGCVDLILSHLNLYQRSLTALSAALELSQEHVIRKVEGLSRLQIASLFEHSPNPVISRLAFVCSCCIHSLSLCQEDSPRLIRSLRSESNPVIEDGCLLAALLELAGDDWSLPILCEFFGTGDSEMTINVVTQLRTIVSASLESGRVRMGLAMSVADYDFLLTEVQSTFLTSPLRENVFILATGEAAEAPPPFNSLLRDEHHTFVDRETESLIRLRLRQVLPKVKDSSKLLQKAIATFAALQSARNAEARSLAESFLFDLLNAHPVTAGVFALNLKMDFHFGNRPAEIDLCSPELLIAIEVDGHYHFSDLTAYRRDRRKDLLLQREGFFVVRLLSEDVVPRMDEILQTIIDAVHWRHSSTRFSELSASRFIEKGANHEF